MSVCRNSAGWPPSLLPSCLMARLKPSRASAPSAANGPEISLAIPTLMVSACASGGTKAGDRKSTRLNSSHQIISYAVFCLKKKKKRHRGTAPGRAQGRSATGDHLSEDTPFGLHDAHPD